MLQAELEPSSDLDLVVVGGCGHVGLPLALSFAEVGLKVGIYDVDAERLDQVRGGQMPFVERGAQQLLSRLLPTGRLQFNSEADILGRTDTVVLVIGTPIDEFMNPSTRIFERIADGLSTNLRQDALVVLRSTVFPGTTDLVRTRLCEQGIRADVVFCPERVEEGRALEEIRTLPQLIGALDDRGFDRASKLFEQLDVEIIRVGTREAELTKLLNNTWRYIKFAVANEFFEIAHRAGIDYNQVLHGVRYNYPRGADLPGPGFAAGPCLLKDTMQLAAFSPDHFPMGQAAMLANEGLPSYVVEVLDRRRPLAGRTLGILGMAFKGESDDPRTSLSYKLKKLAAFKGARVICSDPFVADPETVPLDRVLAEADIVVVCAPHRAYQDLDLSDREVVDIWGITAGQTIRV